MRRTALILILLFGASRLHAFYPLDLSDHPHFFKRAVGDVELANLIAYWKLDENTGTSASDSAGSFTGTLVNAPSWVVGISGSALTFSAASSQNVNIPSSVIGNASAFTINLWFNNNDSTTGMLYGEATAGSANPRIFVDINDPAGNIGFGVLDDSGNDGFLSTSGLSLNNNNWHMATAVMYDVSHRDIFIDGVFKAGNNSNLPSNRTTNDANIGVLHNNAFNNYLNRTVDQVRIYNVAITTAQIVNIYNAQK